MSNRVIARYFYSPICPESFAALERLSNLFSKWDEFLFEVINLAENEIVPGYKWFPEEQELVDTYQGNGVKPLLYAKLFINGEEIKGFPPSKKHLEETLLRYSIVLDKNDYSYNYGTFPPHNRIECDEKEFKFSLYNQNNINDACKICTKYHPYLHEEAYLLDDWSEFEKKKENFVNKKLKADEMLGVIAYYKNRSAGFIEAFTLNNSSILGFPVSEINENGLMITCLSVCSEFSGYGLAKRLIFELEAEAKAAGYKSIEVLAFPDEDSWQPFSLYAKLDFIQNIAFENGLILMKKQIDCV